MLAILNLLWLTRIQYFEFGQVFLPVLGIFRFVGFGTIMRIAWYNALSHTTVTISVELESVASVLDLSAFEPSEADPSASDD